MEFAIIVPEMVSHDHAVNLKEIKPISAGFCTVKDGFVECHGFSTSLNLLARKGDATVVLTTLLFMGVQGLTETGPKNFTPGLTTPITNGKDTGTVPAPAFCKNPTDLPVCQRRSSDALPQIV